MFLFSLLQNGDKSVLTADCRSMGRLQKKKKVLGMGVKLSD